MGRPRHKIFAECTRWSAAKKCSDKNVSNLQPREVREWRYTHAHLCLRVKIHGCRCLSRSFPCDSERGEVPSGPMYENRNTWPHSAESAGLDPTCTEYIRRVKQHACMFYSDISGEHRHSRRSLQDYRFAQSVRK